VPNFKVNKKWFLTHIFFFILQFSPFSFWSFNFILKVHFVYFLVTRFGRGWWNLPEIKLLYGHITTIKKWWSWCQLVLFDEKKSNEVFWGLHLTKKKKIVVERDFFFQFNFMFFFIDLKVFWDERLVYLHDNDIYYVFLSENRLKNKILNPQLYFPTTSLVIKN